MYARDRPSEPRLVAGRHPPKGGAMKTKVFFMLASGWGLLWSQGGLSSEVVRDMPVGAVQQGVGYRGAVCPNGVVVVHSEHGDVVVLDRSGSVLTRKSGTAIQHGTASTCDEQNRLFVAARGYIHVFEMAAPWDFAPKHTFWVTGIGLRLLVDGDILYILGYARADGAPAMIRRYLWREGQLLGTMAPDVPLHLGKAVNLYAPEGSLIAQRGRGRLLYVPANPFEFHVFDGDGRLADVVRPSVPLFRNVDPSSQLASRVMAARVDWVVNSVELPDGKVVAHVVRRGDLPGESAGAPYSSLNVFDSELRLTAGGIVVGDERFPGLLFGADASGHLYFAKLSVREGGRVLKVRLKDR
jgi:hypothetical protein